MAREIPQYVQQLGIGSMPKVQYSNAQAELTQKVSAELGAFAENTQQKASEIEKIKVESTFRTKMDELSKQYKGDPAAIKSAADGWKKGFLGGIKDSHMSQVIDARYDLLVTPYIDKATVMQNRALDEEHTYQLYNNYETSLSQIRSVSSLLTSNIPEHRQSGGRAIQLGLADLESALSATGSDGSPLVSPEKRFVLKQRYVQEALGSAAYSYIQDAPNPIEAMNKWQSGEVSFSLPNEGAPVIGAAGDAINFIIDKFEGESVVSNDGGKGASKFGINKTANPEVDVNNLTREEAVDVYKRKYWDAIKADSLPENVRLMALDTAINFGQDTAKQMLKQAGNDPAKLAQIRAQKHTALLESDPKTYGKYEKSWKSRDKFFAEQAANEVGVDIRSQMEPSQVAKLDKFAAEKAKEFALKIKVDAAVSGAAVLDPKDKDDKAAVNSHFKESLASFAKNDKTGNNIDQYAMQLVSQYGMVPEVLQGQIRAGLRSTNPDEVVARSNMIQQMRMNNPAVIDDFSSEELRIANTVLSLTGAGYEPVEAVIRATDMLKVSPDVIEARKQQYKTAPIDAKSKIESKFNSFFASDPDVPQTMIQDYDRLAEAEFQRTGDLDSAAATALDRVTRTWSKSSVGLDNGWVKNPPEKYYAAPVQVDNSSWMNKQLESDFGLPADRLMVVDSNKKVNGKPVYYVFKKDDNGLLEKVNNTVWCPKWESSEMFNQFAEENKDKITAARATMKDIDQQNKDSKIRNLNRGF